MPTFNRPLALLGEAEEAARLVCPNSDAEGYFDAGLTSKKARSFIGCYGWLANPDAPRGGMVGTADGETVIAGEPHPIEENLLESNYRLTIAEDTAECTIEVTRVTFDTREERVMPILRTLGYVTLSIDDDSVPLQFTAPDLVTPLSPPQQSEMEQLLCVAADMAEYALD